MRQIRIYNKGSLHGEWVDVNSIEMISYAKECSARWRQDGYSYEDIRFEFRNKPNIFTRIKEWWNNE